MSIKDRIQSLFSIDLRSLALFRVGLGSLLLSDLVLRAGDVRAFYTDFGVLSRAGLLENFAKPGHLSLYYLNGTTLFAGILFVVSAIAAIALIVGYKARLATIICWVLLASLHTRNPIVLQGGDILLRMLFFWSMFLPLGLAYSADNNPGSVFNNKSPSLFSAATVALLLQVCFMYWFTVSLKSSPRWWGEASAVYYALSLDAFATPLGKYLLKYPSLLKLITRATMWIELFGPVFAFCPFFSGIVRTVVVFIMILFHLGLALTMNLGLFPYICMVAWIPFLPGWFWENKLPRLKVRAGII